MTSTINHTLGRTRLHLQTQCLISSFQQHQITLLRHSRSRYSRLLQLIIELVIQAHTRDEPDLRFRLNDRTHQTALLRHLRSRYSRRLQLIIELVLGASPILASDKMFNLSFRPQLDLIIHLTHTRGELDQHLTGQLLVRPIRPNIIHSANLKATTWIQPAQLYILYFSL
ncbi:hypothetical protein GIB67_015545 [Kingdonia uniflora]|uniref:Uncharacterized protein n=1 Tax=Kingdonia uniflora TaxID=39325 RepID=A0A7J7MT94_9MAGN|nr:hypothetical protein GIB67_014877 [Kingdonia uniflora]KAF6163955.1 hypothetical protein GIB67_015545 [Kingdonia uniflora]